MRPWYSFVLVIRVDLNAKPAAMAPRRTRSAAKQMQLDGDSSNVTDYVGSYTSKRQKRDHGPANPEASTSRRVTRSSGTARNPPDTLPLQTRRRAARRHAQQVRRNEEDEQDDNDDDDDASVHVDHDQISSAINQARLVPRRTVHPRQVDKSQWQNPGGGTAAKDVAARDTEAASDAEVESSSESSPERPGRDLRSRTGRVTREIQQSQLGTGRQGKPSVAATLLQENPDTPSSKTRSRRAVTASHGTANDQPSNGLHLQQQALVEPIENESSVSDDESRAETSGSEESEDVAASAFEDSAFIEAPRSDEKLSEIEVSIFSFGGVNKALGHPAWTGQGKQRVDMNSQCETRLGSTLLENIRKLNDLLTEAVEVRDEEDDAALAYAKTIDCLRNHGAQVQTHLAVLALVVDKICNEKLASKEHLTDKEVKARKLLLRDATQYLVPASILLIENACDIAPSLIRKGRVSITLNSFTLQLIMRSVGWASRLLDAVLRGLENWPIDDEFSKDEKDLDEDEVESKRGKEQSREDVKQKVTTLSSIVRMAETRLAAQEIQALRERHQEQLRRTRMMKQRELQLAAEQKKQEELEDKARRLQLFALSVERLKSAPDPMQQKWRQVEASHSQQQASGASLPRSVVRVHSASEETKGTHYGISSTEDDNPFASVHENNRVAGVAARNSHASGLVEGGLPNSRSCIRTMQTSLSRAKPVWTKEEEEILIKSIRYERNYKASSMAWRLNRSEEDVSRKAALFKAMYRKIYTERGVNTPDWLL